MRAGERAVWSLALGDPRGTAGPVDPGKELAAAVACDERWVARVRPPGAFAGVVRRSALVLRLLVQDATGAIAAAGTTSLPEQIGGPRNWDYRYCWLRDAGLSIEALLGVGLHDEAERFWDWLEGIGRWRDELAVLYTVDGHPCTTEDESHDLSGYRDSRPVRFGNGAGDQKQLDVPGYVLDAALKCHAAIREPHEGLMPLLRTIADGAARDWRHPDRGVWEIRGPARHYVHSKMMSWVALDRALRLAERQWLTGDTELWSRERDAVRQAILEEGFDERRGSFVQAFGAPALDAAVLMMPIVGFLPGDDPRVLSTIDAISRHLGHDDLLYRYRIDDGLPGAEGAFLACSFWRVEALALAGRRDDAHELMTRLVARTNDVGLLSEEIDPRDGAFLGNLPQAFSHLTLVRAALALEHAETDG